MVESFLKGGILLYAKESIIRATKKAGLDEVSAGLIGGFGGGENNHIDIDNDGDVYTRAILYDATRYDIVTSHSAKHFVLFIVKCQDYYYCHEAQFFIVLYASNKSIYEGVAQVTVLGPCTFLVTAAVTGDKSVSLWQHTVKTYKSHGIGGFYHGGTALVLRQGGYV